MASAFVQEAPLPATPTMVPVEPVQAMALADKPEPHERLEILAAHSGDLTHAMDASSLAELGSRVVEDYEADKSDRSDWEETVKAALQHAAQEGKDAARTYPWNGASCVRYPLLTVGALQFAARAYPAIVKGEEAVSVKVSGRDGGVPASQQASGAPQQWAAAPGAKAARAQRVREFLNSTIFTRIDDWESDTDALLHQLPIVGCAFRKVWWDAEAGKQCMALVPALRLIAPIGAKTCRTAPRLTEEIPDVYPIDIYEKMRSGFYRNFDLLRADELDREPRLLLEQHRLIDMDEDGFPEPYVVTVDLEAKEVLRVEANYGPHSVKWNGDGKVARIERGNFYVKYEFFPHPEGKFYGIGLGHLLKHIGAVVDTAINQMVDAGNAQVAGGGFIASGVRLTGTKRTGNLRFQPGEYKTVDVPGDLLRNAIVERTFPGPSQIMMNILEMMLGAATDISSVKDVVTGEASNNGQVGTTLALIEQGLAQFTAIYKRIYRSLKEEYQLLFENIARYGGEQAAKDYAVLLDDPAADFEADFRLNDLDIRPVSDPSSVTKMQKMARAQFLMQFVGSPGVNPQAIMRRAWEAADVDDPDELFLPPQQPQPDPAVMAKADRDVAEAEKARVEAAGKHLDNLAKAFGAGAQVGIA
jgi:chaperonin GroES